MPTIPERLETATALVEADQVKLAAIVNGAEDAADVTTTGGDVSPVAKVIKAGEDAMAAAVVTMTEAGAGAVALATAQKDLAVTAKTAAETAQGLAEGFRDEAEALKGAAETARDGAVAAEVSATAIAAGDVLPFITTRATAPFLLFDGTTTSRRAEMTPGTAGAVAGMPASFPFEFDVPTSNPSVDVLIWQFAPVSTGGLLQANTLWLDLSPSGGLVLRQYGAISDNRTTLTYSGFSAAYSGLRVRGMVVFETGNTTTTPKIYVNGVDISASLTLATNGTAPNWMPTTLDTTKFVAGLNWPAGRLVPHAPIIGALTAAEVLAWTQTGLLPNWCYAGTGSAVSVTPTARSYSSGSSDASNTTGVLALRGVASAEAGARTGGAGSYYARNTCNDASGGPFGVVINQSASHIPGKAYRVSLWVRASAPINACYIQLMSSFNSAMSSTIAFDATTDWQLVDGIVVATAPASGGSSTGLFVGRVSSVGVATTLDVDDVIFQTAGPIARHTLQPGAVVHPDDGANKLPLLLTAGVTAVGATPNEVVIPGPAMTADGFIHADQVITPTGYELVAAYALQTGTETSTITVKETSSGGTTVATGALSASVTRVALTVSNGLLAGGKKLHLANSSWAGNTITPFFRFARCV